jgi:hypothetical protein
MIAGAVMILSVILIGIAGKNSHSALAETAAGFFTLGVLAALVCTIAALWRGLRKDRHDQPRKPIPGDQNALPPYPAPLSYPAGYIPDPYADYETRRDQPPGTMPAAVRTDTGPPWLK